MEYLTQLMDMCIKNGGDLFFVQVASPEFTDELIELVHKRASLPPNVREKLLQCVQDWRYLAQTRPDKLGHLVSSVEQLEKDGVSFPPPDPNAVSAAQAFVETPVIPEWNITVATADVFSATNAQTSQCLCHGSASRKKCVFAKDARNDVHRPPTLGHQRRPSLFISTKRTKI